MVVRPARPADALAVAGVHVRSWQVGYRGLMPDEHLDGLRPEERATRYTFGSADPAEPLTLVATDDGDDDVWGFATISPARDPDRAGAGEVCALYVDPARWDTGVGRVLMGAARDRLTELGFTEAVLWVLEGNQRAERFYRRDGWRPDGAHRQEDVWGIEIDEDRFARRLP
jgi:GNAT superfamily N-acetyltransferase